MNRIIDFGIDFSRYFINVIERIILRRRTGEDIDGFVICDGSFESGRVGSDFGVTGGVDPGDVGFSVRGKDDSVIDVENLEVNASEVEWVAVDESAVPAFDRIGLEPEA